MASWQKVKTEVSQMVYANKPALLVTGLLASFGLLPVISVSIRDSRVLDNVGGTGKAMISVIQDAPIPAMTGTALIFGMSWLYWGHKVKYVWQTDYAFFPTLVDSFLSHIIASINVCAARGRRWIVTVFRTSAMTITTTILALIIYVSYEGMFSSAKEGQPPLKEAHVA